MTTKHHLLPPLRFALFSLLALTIATGLGTSSFAGPVDGSFLVSIGESTRLLEAELRFSRGEITNLQLQAIQQEESCKNPTARLHDRNRVALMLQNESSMENALTSFTIDLTELGYEFGTGDIPTDGFGGQLIMQSNRSDPGVTATASYGTTDGSTDQTKLTINLNGLTPGRAVIFRVDLDPVPMDGSFYPDYRGIMVGGDVGLGPTDPALIAATFAADGMEASTPEVPFLADIEEVITTSGLLERYHSQASSQMYEITGEVEPIPEPASAILLLAGVAGLMGLRSRRRSR